MGNVEETRESGKEGKGLIIISNFILFSCSEIGQLYIKRMVTFVLSVILTYLASDFTQKKHI